MESYYRCAVCGGFHVIGYSHDEWIDYLRDWDEEDNERRSLKNEILRY